MLAHLLTVRYICKKRKAMNGSNFSAMTGRDDDLDGGRVLFGATLYGALRRKAIAMGLADSRRPVPNEVIVRVALCCTDADVRLLLKDMGLNVEPK